MGTGKINTDRILGISAMVISVLTLVIFIYQTNIMRIQSKLSVKPRLSFSTSSYSTDSLVRIEGLVYNKGLGPAIVDSIYIAYRNHRYEMDMDEFIKNEMPILEKYGELIRNSTLGPGNTFLPGEEITIYSYQFHPENFDSILRYLDIRSTENLPFQFKVIYTSIYEDEHWLVSSESDDPEKLDK
ncbi:MAG: hypothetical protein AAGB24_10255 [Bacteroidota bacterium]